MIVTTTVCAPHSFFFFFNDTATTEIYTLSLHDALPICADGDHVALATVAEVRRELVSEGAVAVRPLPQVVPVDPDLAVAIHAVELDEHEPARIRHGNKEGLAVPAHAARQRPALRAGGILLAEFPLDAPIVRHVQRPPGGVGERRLLCPGHVPEMESPSAIERPRRPLLGGRRRAPSDQHEVEGGGYG